MWNSLGLIENRTPSTTVVLSSFAHADIAGRCQNLLPASDGPPLTRLILVRRNSAPQPACRKPFRLCTIDSWRVTKMESVIKRAISGDANGSPEGTGRRYEAILRLSEALSRCQEPEDLTDNLSKELRD